jgi:hypothetical protein
MEKTKTATADEKSGKLSRVDFPRLVDMNTVVFNTTTKPFDPESTEADSVLPLRRRMGKPQAHFAWNPGNRSLSEVKYLEEFWCAPTATLKWRHRFPALSEPAWNATQPNWHLNRDVAYSSKSSSRLPLREALRSLDTPPPAEVIDAFERLIDDVNRELDGIFQDTRSDQPLPEGVETKAPPVADHALFLGVFSKSERNCRCIGFCCTPLVAPCVWFAGAALGVAVVVLVGALGGGSSCNCPGCRGCSCSKSSKRKYDRLPLRSARVADNNFGHEKGRTLRSCCWQQLCCACATASMCTPQKEVGTFAAEGLYHERLTRIAALLKTFNDELDGTFQVDWAGGDCNFAGQSVAFQSEKSWDPEPWKYFEIRLARSGGGTDAAITDVVNPLDEPPGAQLMKR